MTQHDRRLFLIERLLAESPRHGDTRIPQDAAEQKHLLRALCNIRAPGDIGQVLAALREDSGD